MISYLLIVESGDPPMLDIYCTLLNMYNTT